jgi:hypothetical protein
MEKEAMYRTDAFTPIATLARSRAYRNTRLSESSQKYYTLNTLRI